MTDHRTKIFIRFLTAEYNDRTGESNAAKREFLQYMVDIEDADETVSIDDIAGAVHVRRVNETERMVLRWILRLMQRNENLGIVQLIEILDANRTHLAQLRKQETGEGMRQTYGSFIAGLDWAKEAAGRMVPENVTA